MPLGQDEKVPSLRESLNSAVDAVEKATPAPAAAPVAAAPKAEPSAPAAAESVPSSSPTAAASAPTPDAKPAEAAPDPNKPADADPNAAAKPQEGEPAKGPLAMPPGFPGGQTAWDAAPAEQRAWVKGRERQVEQYIRTNAAGLNFGRSMYEVLRPFAPMLQAAGVQAPQVLQESLQMHYAMTMGTPQQKVQALQRMAHNYGVDLGATQGYDQPGDGAQVAPEVAELRDVVRGLVGYMQTAEGKRQQEQYQHLFAQATSLVNEKATDTKTYPYLNHPGVRDVMATLFEKGAVTSFDHAYKMAMQTRPELVAVQVEQDAARRAREAQNARDGAPPRGGAPVAAHVIPNDESLRSLIARQVNAAA